MLVVFPSSTVPPSTLVVPQFLPYVTVAPGVAQSTVGLARLQTCPMAADAPTDTMSSASTTKEDPVIVVEMPSSELVARPPPRIRLMQPTVAGAIVALSLLEFIDGGNVEKAYDIFLIEHLLAAGAFAALEHITEYGLHLTLVYITVRFALAAGTWVARDDAEQMHIAGAHLALLGEMLLPM